MWLCTDDSVPIGKMVTLSAPVQARIQVSTAQKVILKRNDLHPFPSGRLNGLLLGHSQLFGRLNHRPDHSPGLVH